MSGKKVSSEELISLGAIFHSQGMVDKALEKFDEAAKIDPKNVDAHYNKGIALQLAGRLPEAEKSFKKALSLNKDDFESYFNLGTISLSMQQLKKAEKMFRMSLKINPSNINTITNLGVTLQYQNKFTEAIECFSDALKMDVDNLSANNNLGVAMSKIGLLAESLAYFKKVIQTNPDYADGYNNIGNSLYQLNRLPEAKDNYIKALELNSNYIEAHVNLGIIHEEERRYDLAIESYSSARKFDPDNSLVLAQLYYAFKRVCDWDNADAVGELLDKSSRIAIKQGVKPGEDSLRNIIRIDDPQLNLRVANTTTKEFEKKGVFKHKRRKNKKIRIGYFNDFAEQPIASLTDDLYGFHNRDRFEIHCYSIETAERNKYRNKVERLSDSFTSVAGMTRYQIAERIHKDDIDILVDLKGNTRGQLPETLGMRPAPVQISYLGHPGTTGASYFDYLIVDKILVPEKLAKYCSEKLIYMPDCYQINSKIKPSTKRLKRSDFGLREDSIVLASFNQPHKLNIELFKTWLRILKKAPKSVLWVHVGNSMAEQNIKEFAESHGVEGNRIIFTSYMKLEEHLTRSSLIDIALDTDIYNGGATSSYMLLAGVPVVTVPGKHYAARMTASMLTNLGMEELIARNLKQYEQLATRLALNAKELKKSKNKILKNIETYPLFDSEKFTRNLEMAYEKAWLKYLDGKTPRSFKVIHNAK